MFNTLLSPLYLNPCINSKNQYVFEPERIVHLVTCLPTDVCLAADQGVASSNRPSPILSWRLIMKSFLPSFSSLLKDCCQLQAKVCAQSTGYPLSQACPGKKSVVW